MGWLGWVLGLLLLAVAVAIMRKLRFGWAAIAIVAAGMVLYVLYFGYTSIGERNHDGPEQLKYIRFIASGVMPKADQCFVCHHPPGYYVLAAAAYKLCELTSMVAPHRGVQLMSLGLAFAFIVFGCLTVRRFTDKQALVAMAAGMLTFWPYSTMNSVRMHNDILFGALMAAGLYMVVRWQQDTEARDLWIACGIAALSVMTKSSGYVLVATIGLVILYRLIAEPGRLALIRLTHRPLIAAGVVIAAFALMRGPSTTDASAGERVFGTAYKIKPHDWVGNEPHNYLYFDPESFLREPYLLSRRDGSGRQYYWNHLLKSSLFATHNDVADVETSYRFNRRLAEIMNLLLLAMVIYGLAGLLGTKKRSMGRFAAPIAFVSVFIGMHIAFKVIIPSAHHNDFRLVYPVLIVGSLGYVLAVDGFSQRRPAVGYLGHLLAVPFLLMAIVYYLPKYNFVVRHFPKKVLRQTMASLAKVRPERADWWRPPAVVMAGDELIEINLGRGRKVAHIDASFDGNDRYAVQLLGRGEPRMIFIGPQPKSKKFRGLVRYTVDVDPPAEWIHAVRIWPHRGDMAYSVGHFTVR